MAKQVEPLTLPDVAPEPHAPSVYVPDACQGVLQEALPEITQAAKKLSEIAGQLGEADVGQ